VHLREVADLAFVDVDATLAAIDTHRDLVCGIKVRSSGLIVGAMGTALRPRRHIVPVATIRDGVARATRT